MHQSSELRAPARGRVPEHRGSLSYHCGPPRAAVDSAGITAGAISQDRLTEDETVLNKLGCVAY